MASRILCYGPTACSHLHTGVPFGNADILFKDSCQFLIQLMILPRALALC
ncbi:hypothetical protein EAY64_07780 [Aquitalea palustris]|uniref:Uncharacterized protein n=1 Tax=Aquitalea palustris TaxID=2480983 RepID=A0A454JJV2_9NEIS|nr:hypothetical protein EAY64_07780 [Aquitalea palustris]